MRASRGQFNDVIETATLPGDDQRRIGSSDDSGEVV